MNSTFDEVVVALKQKMVAIDDSAAHQLATTKVMFVGEIRGKAVMICKDEDASLKEMYVDLIGNVHISTVLAGSLLFAKALTVDAAIKMYNDSRSSWFPHKITKLMTFGNEDTEPVPVEEAAA